LLIAMMSVDSGSRWFTSAVLVQLQGVYPHPFFENRICYWLTDKGVSIRI